MKFAIALTLISLLFTNDPTRQTVPSLWKEYGKAMKDDRPKDAANILEMIKSEAASQHLVWDFYDAGKKYVDVRVSSNWKLRQDLEQARRNELEALGEPIAIFFDGNGRHTLQYVKANEKALREGNNKEFYTHDNIFSLPYGRLLVQDLRNDYSFALWSLFASDQGRLVSNALRQELNGKYPYAQLCEYTAITRMSDNSQGEALEAFARNNSGKAVSLFARQDLLWRRFNKLEASRKSTSEEFTQLRKDCEAFLKERNSFSGKEKQLARCCGRVENLINTLNSKDISIAVENDSLLVAVRNLGSVQLLVKDGGNTVLSRTLNNPEGSFYATDTIRMRLPELDDSDYTIRCSNGKTTSEQIYGKHTLSIATRRDSEGYAVYAADFKSGEPLSSFRAILYNEDDIAVASAELDCSKGFARLPKDFTDKIARDKWGFTIQASCSDKGRKRLSPKHGINRRYFVRSTETVPDSHCMILTDRSAFNPDETVHFKAVLYAGTYEYKVREAVVLSAVLFDAQGKEIASKELKTNEFGSAAGEFVLTKGERGGMYRIDIRENGKTVASQGLTVDEFVLPSFSLEWDKDELYHLPGDEIKASGIIRAYSGHALNSADISYTVRNYGLEEESGKLELTPDGRFELRFKAPEKDGYHHCSVSIKVVDATGETQEYSNGFSISSSIPFSMSIDNAVAGSFQLPGRREYGEIVSGDAAIVRLDISGREDSLPGASVRYSFNDASGKELSAGTCRPGKLELGLKGLPTGFYTLTAEVAATGGNGKEYKEKGTVLIFKASDDDTILNTSISSFFKEVGNGPAIQVGVTDGPAWIVAEIFGNGDRLLESRLVRMDGRKDLPGSLQTIAFDIRDGWPEELTMRVFHFHNGEQFSYTREIRNPKAIYQLPICFSRFLDTTAPSHDYSFSIKTAAGVECAAAIFDKSSETINGNSWYTVRPANPYNERPEWSASCGSNSTEFGTIAGYGRTKGLRLFKSAAAPMMMETASMVAYNSVAMDSAAIVEEEAMPMMDEGISIREDMSGTIAWEPFLRSDSNGDIRFDFRTGDKLSTFVVQLFAHDKAFNNNVLRQEMTVTLPVKIALVQPQCLYEGDRYVARVSVANSLDSEVAGIVSVRFVSGDNMQTARKISERKMKVRVPAGGSTDTSFEISAPSIETLGMIVSFKADNTEYGSDGVFVTMPVTPASQTIIEAHSALLRSGADKAAVEKELRSMFVNIRGKDARKREISILQMLEEAIPEKIIPSGEDVLSQSESLFATWLLANIPGREKDFVPDPKTVEKITACVDANGGFAWFAGMNSSPIVTAVLLERFHEMGSSCPQAISKLLPAAVGYLDRSYFSDDRQLLWRGGISMEQYLHTRSLYPDVELDTKGIAGKTLKEFRDKAKDYLTPSKAEGRGLNGEIFAKARRMQTLRALIEGSTKFAGSIGIASAGSLRKSLDADITSLSQYAEPHKSGGMYYPNAVMPWRGLLESELYAHTLICKLLTACGQSEIAEGIRLWTMVQKETQKWEQDPSYVEAISCVMGGKPETLSTKVLALSGSTVLPFSQVKASGNGFTIEKKYYLGDKELKDGDVLHIGDKVTARYIIWNEENRSFVKITAPRPASLRPVIQTSGRMGWWSAQGYRSVLADCTEFWYDCYPEETSTITEEFHVTQEGSFQTPAVTIESLYAPHYRANDSGHGPIVSE